jgi:hypothetical protein
MLLVMDLFAFLSSAFLGQILLFPHDSCTFSTGYEVQVLALISIQNNSQPYLTEELKPGCYEFSWDHQVPT